ncbi:MAG: hypothetical protein HQL63_12700 [Magnetococcales bacterium]|nr:hypothetical protein [Magnetococcales bacterium]MBF0322587.1 hypothetical protein [Magnetococcales bacterium]
MDNRVVAPQAKASVVPGLQSISFGNKSVKTFLTSSLKEGIPAGTETPAPQKRITSWSSRDLRNSSGIRPMASFHRINESIHDGLEQGITG